MITTSRRYSPSLWRQRRHERRQERAYYLIMELCTFLRNLDFHQRAADQRGNYERAEILRRRANHWHAKMCAVVLELTRR